MRGSDFKKTSRLGCPACYEAFSEELAPLLGAMQKGTQHAGKVPASEKVTTEIEGLKKALERAVAAQDFEEAAKLRDRVRDLKASRPAGSETPGA
jgi:protein arginine kinase activator